MVGGDKHESSINSPKFSHLSFLFFESTFLMNSPKLDEKSEKNREKTFPVKFIKQLTNSGFIHHFAYNQILRPILSLLTVHQSYYLRETKCESPSYLN
jgi:hypothetical protein